MTDDLGRAAWQAYEAGDFAVAVARWERLVREAENAKDRDAARHGLGYALVALRRFDEARAIYWRLYEKNGSHVALHQLGMVEREAGACVRAAEIFEAERALLPPGDDLARATNLYERSLVAHLRGERELAWVLAEDCFRTSRRTRDPVLHGCADRLLGDLCRDDDAGEARRWYLRARAAFASAGDETACAEIDARLEALDGP